MEIDSQFQMKLHTTKRFFTPCTLPLPIRTPCVIVGLTCFVFCSVTQKAIVWPALSMFSNVLSKKCMCSTLLYGHSLFFSSSSFYFSASSAVPSLSVAPMRKLFDRCSQEDSHIDQLLSSTERGKENSEVWGASSHPNWKWIYQRGGLGAKNGYPKGRSRGWGPPKSR